MFLSYKDNYSTVTNFIASMIFSYMQPVLQQDLPKYDYTPNDFLSFSVITTILFGILSPLTLILSIPALALSILVSYVYNTVELRSHPTAKGGERACNIVYSKTL